MKLKNELPSRVELDRQYGDYVKACDKLAQMRSLDSKATLAEIDAQYRLTELMLQEWINSANHFNSTLN